MLAAAVAAEDAGFDSVWVADHVVIPEVSDSVYPYRSRCVPFTAEDGSGGEHPARGVAGCTSGVRLGTSVQILPNREPLRTAKAFATLDVLSNGRVELAVGAGWWAEEFAVLGQPFDRRGKRMDEQITILKRAWTDGS